MVISGRAAAARMKTIGLSRRQADRALAAHLAGVPVPTPSALLFEEVGVDRLLEREQLTVSDVTAAHPRGVLVLRRDVDALAPAEEQREVLSGGWEFCLWTAVLLRGRIEDDGPYPVVATVAGFVVAAAELTAVKGEAAGTYRLGLAEPAGDWVDLFHERRLPLGPGRSWVVLDPGAPTSALRRRRAWETDRRRSAAAPQEIV